MGSIFTNHPFPKYEEKDVIKLQMDGFDDPTLKDFTLLDSSSLMKDEFKEKMFEDEFILSFLNAAKELAKAGRNAVDKPEAYIIYRHSYPIPVLFLTRHCMELAIKRAIRKTGGKPKMNHGLTGLWSSLLSRFPGQKSRDDRTAIKNMGAFVQTIADIDDNGISLRYPQDKVGKLTQDKPLFVSNEKIVSYLEQFVEQLELVDFDSIRKDGK